MTADTGCSSSWGPRLARQFLDLGADRFLDGDVVTS
jgi:hypothetical protein